MQNSMQNSARVAITLYGTYMWIASLIAFFLVTLAPNIASIVGLSASQSTTLSLQLAGLAQLPGLAVAFVLYRAVQLQMYSYKICDLLNTWLARM